MSHRLPRMGNLSVKDVAKILHVTDATVRAWINSKRLKALGGDEPVVKGKRRFLQIRKDDLVEFLRANAGEYDMELLRAYGIKDVVDPTEIPDEVKSYYDGPHGKKEVDPNAAYTVSDISQLDGAWAPEKLVGTKRAEETYKEASAAIKEYAGIRLREATATCSVVIDERIAVANVSYGTAVKIVEAMMSDQACVFRTITIEKTIA